MKKIFALAGIGLTLGLSACSGGPSGDSKEPQQDVAPAQTVTPKPTPTESKSVRGNTVKKVGDSFSWRKLDTPDGAIIGTGKITKIEEITCDQPYAQPSNNGTFLALTVDITTKPELAEETLPEVSLSAFDFKYIAKNGTTFNGNLASFGCIDPATELPSLIGPAEKVHGVLILDVPATDGILVTGKTEWPITK